MKTQLVYVEIKQKTNLPINIIPTHLIKCTHCNVYVDARQMQFHSEMHISPLYLHAISNKNKQNSNKKIDLTSMLNSQHDLDDINIRSFLPDEMPSIQTIRKEALAKPIGLQQNNKQLKNHRIINQTIFIKGDSLNFQPRLPVYQQFFQSHEPLIFKKDIKLTKKTIPYQTKNVQIYANQKILANKIFVNQIVVGAKQLEQQRQTEVQQKQNLGFYNIYPKEIKKQNNGHMPIKIQIKSNRKNPVFKQQISTFSSKSGTHLYQKIKKEEITPQEGTQQGQKNQVLEIHTKSKFQCQECDGFYCRTCGSDIPPIYRPIITKNKKQQNLSLDAKNFYKSHTFSQSQGKTSRVTGCTNCE